MQGRAAKIRVETAAPRGKDRSRQSFRCRSDGTEGQVLTGGDEASREGALRLDKWLWIARFFKTRTLATRRIQDGGVRVNGEKVTRPARAVVRGDVLTFAQGRAVRVVRIEALGARRGPASEARTLYADLSPSPPGTAGRPDRNDRRRQAEAKRRPLE